VGQSPPLSAHAGPGLGAGGQHARGGGAGGRHGSTDAPGRGAPLATTRKGSPACTTGPGQGASRASRRSKARSWRRSWIGGLTRTGMAWRAGDGSPSRRGSRPATTSSCTSGRSVGKLRRRLGFARLSVRPPLGAPAAPAARPRGAGRRPKTFAELVGEALPERARGKPVEIWCPDEARVGQQGTLTRIWARRGSRPRAPRDRRSSWACLFGAVCPERAIGAGLVLPDATTEAIGLHLAEIGRHVAPGARTAGSCSMGRDGTAPRPCARPRASPSCRCRAPARR
jgi:hypothetical protein